MKLSLVPERVTASVDWRETPRSPGDTFYRAEVAMLETLRYIRLFAKEQAGDAATLENTREALCKAIHDYGALGIGSFTLLFDGVTTYVNGTLLRAPRSSHEAAEELGRLCGAAGAAELSMATDVSKDDLLALEPRLANILRGEALLPETRAFSLRALPERELARSRAFECDEAAESFHRACGVAAAVLERCIAVEQDEEKASAASRSLSALKRVAQELVDVSGTLDAWVRTCASKWGTSGTLPSRAVRATVLALSMARAVGATRIELARVALCTLARDIAVVRSARRPDGIGAGRAPEEAAALFAAANAVGTEAQARIALAFESLALDTPGTTLDAPPSLFAQIVYFARKFVDAVEASASSSPSPQTIVQHIHDTKAGGLYLPVLRLLAAAVHAELPTREQRRRLPSLSHGAGADTASRSDVGAVHEGEIGRTPLPHVLVFMLDYRLTGTIVFREPDATVHQIYFREGAPSLATSEPTSGLAGSPTASPPGRIGAILAAQGFVSVADVERSAIDAAAVGVRLGEFLVGEGLVSREGLDEALQLQLTERVVALANLAPTARYEYVADENLLSDAPGGEEPLSSRPLAILTAVVRVWRDRERIERALRRVEAEALDLATKGQGSALGLAAAFDFEAEEMSVYRRIEAGGARLVTLLQMGVSIEAVETVVSVLYMTRQLVVPGETRAPVFDTSAEGQVARSHGALALKRQAEEAVREGDLDRAEAHASEAARLDPDERENKLLMAWLAAQQDPDLLRDAERLALELLEREPHSEFGLLYYARICRDAGRHGEARRIYDDLLRLFPANVAAAEERRAL
ncbi:MAG: hypothetical protein U0174_18670 [Polyangiaceae bacterium]